MSTVPRHRPWLPVLLAAAILFPPAALAGTGVNDQIRADMAQARGDVRADLAKARLQLETGNLELGRNLPLGRQPGERDPAPPPRAEISADGDLLIDGHAVAIDARQRRELQAYRGQVIDLALQGIDVGERAAEAALDVVDQGIFALLFNALTGRLEHRVERTVRRTVEPGVLRICAQLPALLDSQQRLGESVPEFRPYATLRPQDVDDCARQVRRELTGGPGGTPTARRQGDAS